MGVVNVAREMSPTKPLLVNVMVEETVVPGETWNESGLVVIEKSGTTITVTVNACDREVARPRMVRV